MIRAGQRRLLREILLTECEYRNRPELSAGPRRQQVKNGLISANSLKNVMGQQGG
jgi:hypothetical protein